MTAQVIVFIKDTKIFRPALLEVNGGLKLTHPQGERSRLLNRRRYLPSPATGLLAVVFFNVGALGSVNVATTAR